MRIVVLVLTLLLGAVLGAWYTVYMKRPHLKVTGGGSEPTKYFVFSPEDEGGLAPRVPSDEDKFIDTRDFLVRSRIRMAVRN